MTEYIIYHDKPIFRNNYKQELAVHFKGGTSFVYCDNNKQWLAFRSGNEIGVLNKEGAEFAQSFCNPDCEKIKELRSIN